MSQTENHSYTFDCVHLAPDEQIGSHQHSTWELSYVITGAGMRTIGDMTEPFSSGEVVLVPPGISHCWYFDNKVTDTEGKIENITSSNPQLSSSASFLRLNVLSSLN